MDRPFSKMQVEEILGSSFQCSPISINISIKADGSEKLHLCTNLSKCSRQHPVTNDFIDTLKYPVRFDTAAMVASTVSPPYSLSYFTSTPPHLFLNSPCFCASWLSIPMLYRASLNPLTLLASFATPCLLASFLLIPSLLCPSVPFIPDAYLPFQDHPMP